MILGEILKLRTPLEKLSQMKFKNFSTVRKIAQLIEQVNKEIKFYEDQESKLIKESALFDENGTIVMIDETHIKLKEGIDLAEVEKQFSDLHSIDISDRIEKVTVHESDFGDSLESITPAEFIMLSSVIDFVD